MNFFRVCPLALALWFNTTAAAILPRRGTASVQSQVRDTPAQATYYGGNTQGGQCSFSTYTLPAGLYGVALSDDNWDNAAHCGECLSVTGPNGNSITAMITDICPGRGPNHLDLYTDAFAALANPNLGIIDISWSYVDCPIQTPLQVHNKEGVSPYWFSMQVVNGNEATASMSVSPDSGKTWLPTSRQTYNFFQISSGTASNAVDVKITSSSGKEVVVSGVPIVGGQSTNAVSNYA